MESEQRDVVGGSELEESFHDGDPVVYLVAASPEGFPVNLADIVTFVEYDELFLLREDLDIGTDPLDLCGLRIGRFVPDDGAPELEDFLGEVSAACELEIVPFGPNDGLPSDAVAAGEIDAVPADEVFGAHIMNETPALSLGGPITGHSATGFIVGKETGLAEALAAAIDELAGNGTYGDIMSRHGLPDAPPRPGSKE